MDLFLDVKEYDEAKYSESEPWHLTFPSIVGCKTICRVYDCTIEHDTERASNDKGTLIE